MIYDTGAFLFTNPTIVHCFKAVFYKISTDLEGKLDQYMIDSIEDPPFLIIINKENLPQDTQDLINELFNFIIELKSYKTILKQIDKETPGLLYLVFENKANISSKNINNINKGIELFRSMVSVRNDIMNKYIRQVRDYFSNKEDYLKNINIVGEMAYKNEKKNINEIVFLSKDIKDIIEKKDLNYQMYNSIEEAKKYMLKIIEQETNEDIVNSHESIIIEQKND